MKPARRRKKEGERRNVTVKKKRRKKKIMVTRRTNIFISEGKRSIEEGASCQFANEKEGRKK